MGGYSTDLKWFVEYPLYYLNNFRIYFINKVQRANM